MIANTYRNNLYPPGSTVTDKSAEIKLIYLYMKSTWHLGYGTKTDVRA